MILGERFQSKLNCVVVQLGMALAAAVRVVYATQFTAICWQNYLRMMRKFFPRGLMGEQRSKQNSRVLIGYLLLR